MAITLQHSPAKPLSSPPFEPSHSLHPHTPYSYIMRSFGLAVFASLTFGLFCSAAPTPLIDVLVDADVDVLGLIDVDADVDVIVRRSVDSGSGSSGESSTSLDEILNGVIADITPIADKISKIVPFSIICQVSNPYLVRLPHV